MKPVNWLEKLLASQPTGISNFLTFGYIHHAIQCQSTRIFDFRFIQSNSFSQQRNGWRLDERTPTTMHKQTMKREKHIERKTTKRDTRKPDVQNNSLLYYRTEKVGRKMKFIDECPADKRNSADGIWSIKF